MAGEDKALRLPKTVRPQRYDVHIDARPGRATFTGDARVAVTVDEPVTAIVMHATDLALTRATVVQGDVRQDAEVTYLDAAEAVRLTFPQAIAAGDATLELTFNGHVSPSMEGLYLARDGPEQCLSTQCQETDARRIFPCFDEPEFKASVAWRITTDPAWTVLANGALESTEDHDSGKSRTWRFAPTAPVPTYILAFSIGDFAATPQRDVNGVPLAVWALKGKEDFGAYAQDLTARLLPWFEDYFGAPYPFGKYDQVAVPGFSAGAMENAGLVLFRQSLLLLDPQTASWNAEKQVARVVAHEFAHMWFGNHVTMRWWDDIWLNEAFAEWMAHKAVAAHRPDYRIWDKQLAEKTHALTQDALTSTHAIYHPVQTPAEATELFDAITYNKGAATMRMLEAWLGAEDFRTGLRSYMQAFGGKNAAGADLWRHLEAASGRPVSQVMSAWITQPGHPVLGITLDGARVTVTQRRFFSAPDAAPDPSVWPTPVQLRFADEQGVHTFRGFMDTATATFDLPAAGDVRWCHGNEDGLGVYRVDHSDAAHAALLANARALTHAEAVTLLTDEWALLRANARPPARFLATLAALAPTEDHFVAERVASYLGAVEDVLLDVDDAAATDRFRAWVRATFGPALAEVGLTPRADEPPTTSERRVALVRAVAAVGHDEEAIAACRRLAATEGDDAAAVEPNLAQVAVAVTAKFGDAATFDAFVARYVARRASSAPPQVTDRYLYALPLFEAEGLGDRVFQLIDDKTLPQESVGPLMRAMFGMRHAQRRAWQALTGEWTTIRRTLGDMWTGFLVDASGHLPPALKPELTDFYDERLDGVAQQAYARAVERMDERAEFVARVGPAFLAWAQGR